jgi:aldehyde dehydrogenase (NAD+)
LVGPLIDHDAFNAMQFALQQAQAQGGIVTGGERVLQDQFPDAFYVRPALVQMPAQTAVVRQETFAPILYVLKYTDFAQAIVLNNEVPQGLSSSVFTTDVREAEQFMSAAGSDCGIVNVNIGTSGAERCFWGRETNRWWPRIRLRRVESLHAPRHQHGQLFTRFALGAGRKF